jgi:hypothetical protein
MKELLGSYLTFRAPSPFPVIWPGTGRSPLRGFEEAADADPQASAARGPSLRDTAAHRDSSEVTGYRLPEDARRRQQSHMPGNAADWPSRSITRAGRAV